MNHENCRNLLFSLFVTRYRFEPSHLFSFSYVSALREFPRLLFSTTQFYKLSKSLVFVCSEATAQFSRRAAVQAFEL